MVVIRYLYINITCDSDDFILIHNLVRNVIDLAKGYILHSTKKEKKLHNARSKTEKYSQNQISRLG